MVEQIVSMHPEVGAGDELNFWNERGAAWHRSGTERSETQFVAKEFLAKAATDYLRVLRTIAPTAARVTDKMPFNFLWAGVIHVAPGARVALVEVSFTCPNPDSVQQIRAFPSA